jgi:hypothetical protein
VSRAGGISAALRSATVVAAGAISVHQLRYLVGYGGDASRALDDQGHAYMAGLLPVLALLAGLTIVGTVAAGLAGARTAPASGSSAIRVLLYAGAILVAFGAQEVLEGVLFAGHPAGIAAMLANSGFVAIPLALVAGWTALLAVRGLETFEQQLAAAARSGPRTSGRTALPAASDVLVPTAPSSSAVARAPPVSV